MKKGDLQKYYTKIIGVLFLLVTISLILDFISFGHRPETWHKIFHIIIGIVIILNWNNKKFYRPFCITNGLFFTFVALFGWTFMDFAQLDAFNLTDTILHSIVGVFGLVIGFMKKHQ